MARLDDLIERSIDRFNQLFDIYDRVSVSFSGGKDSTCLLEVGTLAAARRGIKLTVSFFDEEVIFPETVAYCERVRVRPEIDFHWYCIPIKESNAWSQAEPHWYPWAPEARAKWIRPIPPFAISELKPPPKGRPSIEYLSHHLAALDLPRTWVDVIGRRLAESPARRSMAQRLGWLQPPHDRRYCGIASPIIDWSNEDVWKVIKERGWDWNRAYLRLYQAGTGRPQLRIGPLFGEEPSINLHRVRKVAPEMWARAVHRVPGVDALARYALTGLMGRGRLRAGGTVKASALLAAMENLPPAKRARTGNSIRAQIQVSLKYRVPIDPGALLKTAIRGDTKADRMLQGAWANTFKRSKDRGHYRRKDLIDDAKRAKEAADR